jgi:hypothetical protein
LLLSYFIANLYSRTHATPPTHKLTLLTLSTYSTYSTYSLSLSLSIYICICISIYYMYVYIYIISAEGEMTGYGRYIFPNGSEFRGIFLCGLPQQVCVCDTYVSRYCVCVCVCVCLSLSLSLSLSRTLTNYANTHMRTLMTFLYPLPKIE